MAKKNATRASKPVRGKRVGKTAKGTKNAKAKTRAVAGLGPVKTETKNPPGRPSKYTKQLGALICDKIAEGVPLKKVCLEENMPDRETVRRWRNDNPEFRGMYARAQEEFAHSLADDILPISDESGGDTNYTEQGKAVPDNEWISRSKLRVETRKWLAAKLLPKVYGDRIAIDTPPAGTRVIRPHAGE